jgi:predicted dienelactone hydrolase
MSTSRAVAAVRLILAAIFVASGVCVQANEGDFAVGHRQASFTDESRPVKATMGFAGASVRRIDVMIWYPSAKGAPESADAPIASGGPWPLVIYSHGTNGHPDNAMHLVNELVHRGYVVAAPAYPLSSITTYTHIRTTDISDVINQTRDIHFLIDRLLADPFISRAIDPKRIATTGHSLGAVTSYFTSFGVQTRDPRIVATALIGAGDPVQTALSGDMGLAGTRHAAVSVPTLFLTGEKDVFARTTGRPHAAYSRIEKPKYEVLIRGGVHVWFRDNDDQPTGNKNPDCLFFEQNMPGVMMPGCEERVPLIGSARQKEITRAAVLDFFDGYLKQDAAALVRLQRIDKDFPEVELSKDD